MSREWKPGDVAELEVMDEFVRAVVSADERWLIFGHTYFKSIRVDNKTLVRNARPLVVIDPEDSESVLRLLKAFWDNGTDDCNDLDAMTKGLREFADPKPPKPDEPTGLGAVVEDAEGVLWVRCNRYEPWLSAQDTDRRKWADIPAVRVLSEGLDA